MGNKLIEGLSLITRSSDEVLKDIFVMNFTVVNACMVGDPEIKNSNWLLIDTGLKASGDYILQHAEKRFGKNNPPKAIILTHGHFDHVGSVTKLCDYWKVPVYIHSKELPYVTGKKDYPEADSSVEEGIVSKLSPSFPHTSINIASQVFPLPEDGSIPYFSEWKYIHTPGHTEGHISLFRPRDGVLIAGDAFSTVKQESIVSVLTQKEEISGPPKYFTTDWDNAKESIIKLRNLNPSLAVPSHGKPLEGKELLKHLDFLINNFEKIAEPEKGRFVHK